MDNVKSGYLAFKTEDDTTLCTVPLDNVSSMRFSRHGEKREHIYVGESRAAIEETGVADTYYLSVAGYISAGYLGYGSDIVLDSYHFFKGGEVVIREINIDRIVRGR